MGQPVIVVRTHRGLGNQFFQFAAASAVAQRLGVPVRCDAGPTTDRLLRVCLGDDWVAASTRELWRCGTVRHPPVLALASRVRRVTSRAWCRVLDRPPRRFQPANHDHYDPEFERLTAPCYLLGYFQNTTYWAGAIDPLATTICDRLAIAVASGESPIVGVHIRRGDYLKAGWALGPSYYRRALGLVADQVDGAVVRVLGDDPRFVEAFRDQLTLEGHRVERERGPVRHVDAALDDLIRLAECDHLVISNSSFAWWGAALGDHLHPDPGRRVTIPDSWIEGDRSHPLRQPAWQPISCAMVPGATSNAVPYCDHTDFADWWAAAGHVSPS